MLAERGRSVMADDSGARANKRVGRCFPSLLCLVSGILFCVSSLCAQPEPPARFSVTSNLILVDVRVRDSKGRPVEGLKAEDFVLVEEGIAQQIVFFQEISLPLVSVEPSDLPTPEEFVAVPFEPAAPVVPDDPSEMVPLEKRLLILLFDFSSAGLQDSHMMKRAAESFLAERFTADDAAAVLVLDNGLEMLTDFTSDRELLLEAVSHLVSEETETDLSLPGEEADASGDFVVDEAEFGLFQSSQQLAAIQTIADSFRDVPGRKALLYFSTGFSSRGMENDEHMRLATDQCNRANISIYSVDGRGLVALSPGGGAHRAGGGGTQIFSGRASLNELVRLTQSQEGLITMAKDTGGAALVDDNDLVKIFRKAREDGSHYYLLGYQTPASPSDGRFRRIEVRAEAGDSRVLCRHGYYAEKPYQRLSDPEKEFKFLQTVVQDRPISDFPLAISAEYFPESGESYQVPVLLSFHHERLSELSQGGGLNLEIVVLARDSLNVTQTGVRDQVQIQRQQREGETAYVYQNVLLLEPGQYVLTAFVRDNRTGLASRVQHELDLPPFGPVHFSSLILAAHWKPPGAESGYRIKSGKEVTILKNPLQVADRVLVPRIGRQFHQSESLFLHGKISNLSSPGEYQIVLLDAAADEVYGGAWKPLGSDSSGAFAVNARFSLDQLEPGDYQVLIKVRLGRQEVGSLRERFVVVSSGANQS